MKRRLVILVFLAMGIKGYECSAASVDPGFHCKDLFPDKYFQKILGENPSEYKIAEKVENAMNINMLERNRFAVASRADTARGKVLEQNVFSFPVIFL